MFAIIRTGGKQYVVSPGDKIKIEKLDAKEEKEIAFKEVLLVEKNKSSTRAKLGAGLVQHRNKFSGAGKLEIGTPLVEGAKVIGKVLKQDKHKKVIIFKYKSKKRYKLKKGHRQHFSKIEILKIEI